MRKDTAQTVHASLREFQIYCEIGRKDFSNRKYTQGLIQDCRISVNIVAKVYPLLHLQTHWFYRIDCDDCGKGFKLGSGVCLFCWNVKVFQCRANILVIHVTRITWFYNDRLMWNERTPFVNCLLCDQCGSGFNKKQQYNKHISFTVDEEIVASSLVLKCDTVVSLIKFDKNPDLKAFFPGVCSFCWNFVVTHTLSVLHKRCSFISHRPFIVGSCNPCRVDDKFVSEPLENVKISAERAHPWFSLLTACTYWWWSVCGGGLS